MKLGKTIVEHRTKMNLSQGDLADLLDVSRQSVSKWENDLSIPDLDKVIKLSEIFGLSLDEFVKGEITTNQEKKAMKEIIIQEPKRETQKTVGIVLLCLYVVVVVLLFALTSSLAGLILGLPLLLCAVICFACKRNVGLWCSWAVYLLFELYLRWATGINVSLVKMTFHYTAEMNYARLAIAWIILLITLLLIGITILRFIKQPLYLMTYSKKHMIVGWVLWFVLNIVTKGISVFFIQTILSFTISASLAYRLLGFVSFWLRTALFIYLIIYTIRYILANRERVAS